MWYIQYASITLYAPSWLNTIATVRPTPFSHCHLTTFWEPRRPLQRRLVTTLRTSFFDTYCTYMYNTHVAISSSNLDPHQARCVNCQELILHCTMGPKFSSTHLLLKSRGRRDWNIVGTWWQRFSGGNLLGRGRVVYYTPTPTPTHTHTSRHVVTRYAACMG